MVPLGRLVGKPDPPPLHTHTHLLVALEHFQRTRIYANAALTAGAAFSSAFEACDLSVSVARRPNRTFRFVAAFCHIPQRLRAGNHFWRWWWWWWGRVEYGRTAARMPGPPLHALHEVTVSVQ